jgi:hypothetical protein
MLDTRLRLSHPTRYPLWSTPPGKAVRRLICALIFGAELSSNNSTGRHPHTPEGILL